ncbi:MAG: hypothetical protein ABFS05_08055 [Bacteroidota bacterium]
MKIKHSIFILFLALLMVPAIQGYFDVFQERPLHGDFEVESRPTPTKNSWLDGSFQEAVDPWLEQQVGFHNALVRIHNQLDYTLFHLPSAEGVIRGKGGQLYEYDYIRAWTGEDFIGEKVLDKKLRKFRFLQYKLKNEFNIDLILIIEPGKASVYPEDIPDKFVKGEAGKTNYDYIEKRAKELQINLIDFNRYFIDIRDTEPFPVFPKQGTHWSEFAMWQVADSLLQYIESKRNIDLPEVIIDSIVISDSLQHTDYDVGHSLNLLFELDHGPMPYPVYHFEEDTTIHQKPHVLTVADSYYWNIYNTRIPDKLFTGQEFWYFYKKIYPASFISDLTVDSIDFKARIEQQDVIFLMMTERFFHKFDRGFIDDLWEHYGVKSTFDEIDRKKTRIINLDGWFKRILSDASKTGHTIDEELTNEAIYLLQKEHPEMYYSLFGPQAKVAMIRNSPEWFAQIKKSAEEKKISVEEALYNNARYVMWKNHPEALKKYDRILQIEKNIRSDSAWHAHILEKAARYFMTEEEMLRADAEYFYWEENR